MNFIIVDKFIERNPVNFLIKKILILTIGHPSELGFAEFKD